VIASADRHVQFGRQSPDPRLDLVADGTHGLHALTASVVSTFGRWSEMSMPTSAMASTARVHLVAGRGLSDPFLFVSERDEPAG
jgi:hypothetical protein